MKTVAHVIALVLIGSIQCANIFFSTTFGGSHLHSLYDIATILADAGHNITFINIYEGGLNSLNHAGIHGYTIKQDGIKQHTWKKSTEYLRFNSCLEKLLVVPSKEMLSGMFVSDCEQAFRYLYKKSADVYSSNEIKHILDSVEFDLIIAEDIDIGNLAVITKSRNIPIISYNPGHFIMYSLEQTNLPTLPSSQPSFFYTENFHLTPSFSYRFWNVLSILSSFSVFSRWKKITADAYTPLLEKYGHDSYEDVKSSIKMFLTNDHVAITFPYLRPPNDIAIGGASLLDKILVTLPQNFIDFIERDNKPVIYMAFGSYFNPDSYPWSAILKSALNKMDVKIILKTEKDSNLGSKFLPVSWVPQKDLLGSGKVKLFISHCGNNGRIETIFYNVPILCVPLFGDQYINSELVKFKAFGDTLLKEDIVDEEYVIGKVESMMKSHEFYRQNMKKASDIIENEPGNVKKKLLFYVDYVAKYKNIDFLLNEVIQQQNIIEIYNLDIVIPLVFSIFFAVFLIFYIFYRFCRCILCGVYNKILQKKKQD